jgi:Flp pilus assembly protein TadG
MQTRHKIYSKQSERGFLSVMFALTSVVLIGFTGLAIDVGYLQWQRGRVQAAADAAAMGALRELELSQTDLVTAGQNDASMNGFTDGSDNTTVTIANPPTSGSFSGNNEAVQAPVTKVVPVYFMRMFGQTGVTLSATAVARTTSTQGSLGACIFALDPHADSALWFFGNSSTTTACGAVVNSDSSSALTIQGNTTVTMNNGAKIGVVGPGTAGLGWNYVGGGQLLDGTTGKAESPVNIQHFSDPLANVAAPTKGTLIVQPQGGTIVKNDSLQPGVYCGGLTIHGTVTMAAGTYIMAGGGFKSNAQAVVSGTGVTIYNTTGSTAWGCSGSIGAGSVDLNGGAQFNLSAPTNQSPIGVLFFEDRSLSGFSNKINGNSQSTFDGALYFKNSALDFRGTSSASHGYMVIVANTISVGGNANLGNDYEDLANVYTLAPASTGGGLVQ